RGEESDGDEIFVRTYADSAGLPFLSERIDVAAYQASHAISKHEAARALRYAAFERARAETVSRSVATAHHADDNAETVLMNALRGAGVRGLAGIPIRREPGSIIRPLLFAYRNDITAYTQARGIKYREDSSNTSRLYTRNRMRHEVIPFLSEDLQTDAARSLNRISSLMRSLQDILSAETATFAASAVSVDPKRATTSVSIAGLKRHPLFVQDELMLFVLRSIGVEPTTQKIQACLALCDQPTGRSLDLSARWMVLHDRNNLVFSKPRKAETFERQIEIGHEYEFPEFRISLRELPEVPARLAHPPFREFADADRLGSRLLVRSWREGDWFIPLGMSGRKKLSDFFVNNKVPRTDKHSTPILESNGEIVWVCGLRLDQRFSITPATRKAVELTYHPRNPQ
ncbi:MAG TPA: tRNA lysidine(34) synthetase TilS, partial [Bacteroidota bacterium]